MFWYNYKNVNKEVKKRRLMTEAEPTFYLLQDRIIFNYSIRVGEDPAIASTR